MTSTAAALCTAAACAFPFVTLLLALRIDLTPELDAYTWVVPTVTAVLYPLLLLAFQLLPAPFPSRLLSHMTVAHNALLCAASLVMSVGTVIAFSRHSPYASVEELFCLSRGAPSMPPELRLWQKLFYYSKYWELFDTVLLVARNKPLTLLHVYHHAIVIPEVWLLARSHLPWTLGCVAMNAGVHVAMYAYFAVVATGRTVWWRRYVTVLQIGQFSTAAPCVLVWGYHHFLSGGPGCTEVSTLAMLGAFDGSLLLLFLRFYFSAYGEKRQGKKV